MCLTVIRRKLGIKGSQPGVRAIAAPPSTSTAGYATVVTVSGGNLNRVTLKTGTVFSDGWKQ